MKSRSVDDRDCLDPSAEGAVDVPAEEISWAVPSPAVVSRRREGGLRRRGERAT